MGYAVWVIVTGTYFYEVQHPGVQVFLDYVESVRR